MNLRTQEIGSSMESRIREVQGLPYPEQHEPSTMIRELAFGQRFQLK